MGYSPGGRKELDTIEQLGMHTLFNYPADLEHYSVFVILSPPWHFSFDIPTNIVKLSVPFFTHSIHSLSH